MNTTALLLDECCSPVLITRLDSEKTILIVEDDDFVRRATCELLSNSGHHVLEARNAATARALVAFDSQRIDLLVCDALLPDGSGIELCRRFQVEEPELRVILTSGYPLASFSDGFFLNKPYSGNSLLEAIQLIFARNVGMQSLLRGPIPNRLQNLPG